VPHLNQENTKVDCKANPKQQLRDAGYVNMQDIMKVDGNFRTWEEGPQQVVPASCRRAYGKLLGSLKQQISLSDKRRQKVPVYFQEEVTDVVRKYLVRREEVQRNLESLLHRVKPTQAFLIRHNNLTEKQDLPLPSLGYPTYQIIVSERFAASQKKVVKYRVGRITGDQVLSQQFEWSDGLSIFATSTWHMWKLQSTTTRVHSALVRWREEAGWSPNMRNLWRDTWVPFRSAKENSFLWQVIYRIPATQKWGHPHLERLDTETHCTRCRRQRQEDITHFLWTCPN
jgi:hypothetical protein